MGKLKAPVANPPLGRTAAGFLLGTLCSLARGRSQRKSLIKGARGGPKRCLSLLLF